ncbi:MAG: hypothetical protein K6V73_07625 [Firmicutes bacterium]|nr:hypothetical protein [Bacillota bacterium]
MPERRKKRKAKASRLGRGLGEYVRALRRAAAAALAEPPTAYRIQTGWEDCGMANIVAIWRPGSTGLVAGYLFGLLGLGVKDGYLGVLESRADRARLERVEWETCPLETAQELVFGGLEWAVRHGFRVPRGRPRRAQGPAAPDEEAGPLPIRRAGRGAVAHPP